MLTDTDDDRISEAIERLPIQDHDLRSILHKLRYELKWAHDKIDRLEDQIMDLERRE